jgi:hypothetical protein
MSKNSKISKFSKFSKFTTIPIRQSTVLTSDVSITDPGFPSENFMSKFSKFSKFSKMSKLSNPSIS